MTTLPLETMAQRLTTPFARGASTLKIPLVAKGNAAHAPVSAYDFSEYKSLFGRLPTPSYILVVEQDIQISMQVIVDYTKKGSNETKSVTLAIPPGALTGTSFADWRHVSDGTPAGPTLEDPDIQLTTLHMSPVASDNEAAHWWSLIALLGNLASLLWVIGWEKNSIRRHLEIVQKQRSLPTAVKFSLDLLGDDLGIPRFPPLPYSLDVTARDTIALYHMDEPANATELVDVIVNYPQTGLKPHPGQNKGATSGVLGRFGTAFAFRDTAASAEILVPDDPDFNLGATDSFTVECFVKPDADTPAREIRVDHREIIAKHPNPISGTTQAGWALSIGGFQRDLPLNIRFLLSDGGSQPVLLFANRSLSGDRFYHLAGVIDRTEKEARLYIDGTLVSIQSIDSLGVLTNTEPIRIGRTPGAAYRGIVDEVRLSRVARTTFYPVLGEDDEVYRRRLELFRSWSLPTLSSLSHMVNAASGSINNDLQPLVLDDENAELTGGTLELTVKPAPLPAGACIDTLGNRGGIEADVNGTAAMETAFDSVYLVTHNDARVIYTPSPTRARRPGELAAETQKMQIAAKRRLDQLLDLLGSSGVLLRIIDAFDPQSNDLRAVGRGLLLAPPVVTTSNLAQLAQLAHNAGFSYVCNRDDLNAVYVSTEPGDYIEIGVNPGGTATNANGFMLHAGESLNLGIQPTLPPDTRYRWLVIPCGAGRATFSPVTDSHGRVDPSKVILNAATAGRLSIKVEITRGQSVAAGATTFRVGPNPTDLVDGTSISHDGRLSVDESVAGAPGDSFFHPVYLVTHADPQGRVTYGSDINNRRMQPAVAQRLDRLVALMPNATAAGQQLRIEEAYVPPNPSLSATLSGVGRALTLSHPTLSAGTLAVLAHAVGFTYVLRKGNQVLVRQSPDELLTVQEVTPAGVVNISESQELTENQVLTVTLRPRALPTGIAVSSDAIYVANAGSDTISEIDPNTGLIRRALKVGWGPVTVMLSPNGQRLYTADNLSNTVTAVDVVSGNIVKTITVQAGPIALAHHPTAQILYVTCQTDNSLLAIDTNALSVTTTLSLFAGASPTGTALTADGSTLWVALHGTKQIAIVGTNPFTVAATITLPAAPLKIAIAPNGTRGYATLPDAGTIAILDIAGRALLPGPTTNPLAGSAPNALTVASDNSTLYVADTTPGSEQIYILNLDGSLIKKLRVQQKPFDMGIRVVTNTDGSKTSQVLVVGHGDDDIVSVLDPQQKGVASNWRLGSGLGEHLTWVLRPGPATKVHLSSTSAAVVNLGANRAGPVLARAIYALQDHTAPYTFAIRLKPGLDGSTTVIRKDQFDRIMNVLNAFHPIGVEVITHAIRDRVIEVRDNQFLNAFPNYTYPNFRVRGVLPRHARKE